MRSIVFRPEALQEYVESCTFYGARDPEVRSAFETCIDRKLRSIVENHELYPIIESDVREAAVNRFPFTIYFRVTADAIRVISVFHHRRDPSVWQSRVEDS